MIEKNNYLKLILLKKANELQEEIGSKSKDFYSYCLRDITQKVFQLYIRMMERIEDSKKSGAELLTQLPCDFVNEDLSIEFYLEGKSEEEKELLCYNIRLFRTYILLNFFCNFVDLDCNKYQYYRIYSSYKHTKTDFFKRLNSLSDIDKSLSSEELNELISSFIVLIDSIITRKNQDGSYVNTSNNFYQFLGIEMVYRAYKKILFSLTKTNEKRFVLYYQRRKEIIHDELHYLVPFKEFY